MLFGPGGITAGIHVALEVGRRHTPEKPVLSLMFISKFVPHVLGFPKDPGEGASRAPRATHMVTNKLPENFPFFLEKFELRQPKVDRYEEMWTEIWTEIWRNEPNKDRTS